MTLAEEGGVTGTELARESNRIAMAGEAARYAQIRQHHERCAAKAADREARAYHEEQARAYAAMEGAARRWAAPEKA